MQHRVIPIRASSFGTFFDCAYRFEGEQLLKIHRPSSLRAWLGTSIHAGTAAYDQARLNGEPISTDDAAGVMLDTFLSPDADVDLRDNKLTLKEAQRIALVLLSKYCRDIAPHMNYESVEMALEPLNIDCGEGLIMRLTGTMDRGRVIRYQEAASFPGFRARFTNGRVIADLKTGSRLIIDGEVSTRARAAQLGIYQILSEHTDGQETDGSQILALQTSSKCETGVSAVFDAKAMLLGDENTPGLLDMAGKMMKSGLFPPNPQSSLCGAKYCARFSTCKYHT